MGIEFVKARPIKRFKCDICSVVKDIEYDPKDEADLIRPRDDVTCDGWKHITLYCESAEGGVRLRTTTQPRDEIRRSMLACPSQGCQLIAFKRMMSGVSGDVLGLLAQGLADER